MSDLPAVRVTTEKGHPKHLEIDGWTLDAADLVVNTEFETNCLVKVKIEFYTDNVSVVPL